MSLSLDFFIPALVAFGIGGIVGIFLFYVIRWIYGRKVNAPSILPPNNSNSTLGGYVQILRQRFFIDHTANAKTLITEEYTFESNHNRVSNIILQFPKFLPNLSVFDQHGEELTVMTNLYTQVLLESWIDDSVSPIKEELQHCMDQMNSQQIYIIWIKLPANKELMKGDNLILNFEYGAVRENRKAKDLTLKLFPSSHNVFYVIKKPDDFEFDKRTISWTDQNNEDHFVNSWHRSKQNILYYTETNDSVSITSKANSSNLITLNYSFRPQFEIVALPVIAIVLLIGVSFLLWALQWCHFQEPCNLKDNNLELFNRRFELGIFVITTSLVLPRLVSNATIRHRMLFAISMPIVITLFMLLGIH
jgi:hypothetical protein